jgi:hypothetical protein
MLLLLLLLLLKALEDEVHSTWQHSRIGLRTL